MTSATSASASQKTGSATTPFDQIKALEEQENKRKEKEIAAMHKEEEVLQAEQNKRVEDAEEELKAAAKQELKELKESELTSILRKADDDAKAEKEALTKQYGQNKDALIKEAADGLLPLLAA